MSIKEIKRRLAATARRERRNRRPSKPIRVDGRVSESGRYREVSLGPDVYMAEGQRARLASGADRLDAG